MLVFHDRGTLHVVKSFQGGDAGFPISPGVTKSYCGSATSNYFFQVEHQDKLELCEECEAAFRQKSYSNQEVLDGI